MASVTVMGAGIFGLACGWELARRGAHVRVIEAARIGAGSSGGHVGALAPHAPESWNPKKAFQLDSLLMAPDFFASAAEASGQAAGYARVGRLQPVAEGSDMDRLAARIEAARARWPFAMALTDRPEGALIPESPSGQWLWDGLSARMAPRAALACLAHAIRAKGGEIAEGSDLAPEGVVLWATGVAGLTDLGAGNGVKGQSALLRFDAGDAPQVYADGLHIVPHADGTVAIGSTSERDFTDDRPDDQARTLVTRARAICPVLRDAPLIQTWAGIRPRAKSRAPILGAWPGRPGHFIANGGFKIGFGMAPKIAQVMADLVLDGHDQIPADFRFQGSGEAPIT